MQLPLLILFMLVTLAPFASSLGAPRVLAFTPELLSGLVLIYVLVAGPRRRFYLVNPKYWLVFGALTAIIIAGIINGGASAGPVLGALRFYLRALPLFFLPAVCEFSDAQQKQQLKLLMFLSLIQLPIAAYQRYVVWSEGRFTGDPVTGTLLDSGILSIFLICAALVASGLMLRGHLSRGRYVLLMLALLLPTTINETKVTVFYVPIGLLIAFAVGATPGRRLKAAASTLVILVTFGAMFFPIYTYFQSRDPYAGQDDLIGVLTSQKDRTEYLLGGATGVGAPSRDIHRGDSLLVPLQYVARDPITLGLGLGLGAVSPSQLGEQFEGRYYEYFKDFLQTAFSSFVLEIGVLGVATLLLLYWFLFSDALAVARHDDTLVGAVAVGWTGVVVLMCISLVYAEIQMATSLSYLFWYFSGLIAARRVQLGYRAETMLELS
ncbi:MAG TPA: hypothetical protein VMF64_06050, partial [Steroidobacteraceae bacterium]|nr:hypothetical protein [Steroidobacteraceae bacterium]